ncbi:DUF2975 domain-containing protein [Acutalibacter caecimuris]|uniref:DUF2975 domain-containing protein n=1 Tax=Acutalibacter caecimuris TaxID=3093657 RepID=UPI002AC9E245|nr:DUF2975 domain-containing protein [Acutalibacter sp. M00118]
MTKEEKRAQVLYRIATVLTKLGEVAYIVGAVGMLVGLALFVLDPHLPGQWVFGVEAGETLAVQGFSIVIAGPGGEVIRPAVVIFFLTAAVLLGLMARVFRNANRMLRTAQGETPFQKGNVRMMWEIGALFIATTVVQMTAGFIAALVIGPELVETSAGLGGLTTGIVVLCLSQVFALGVRMQEDVDGLV